MRVLVDLKSHVTGPTPLITQVEKIPPVGSDGATAINGKYVLPIIDGVDFRVDSSDYVLNGGGAVDGGDIASISYAHLLAAYPMFGHIFFNPLLTGEHVSGLDTAAVFKDDSAPPPAEPLYYPVRAQMGRAFGGPYEAGTMPTHTAVLSQNNTLSTPRPGILISDLIDIGPYTNNVGADEFMVYWKLYGFEVTHEASSQFGAATGNTPVIRRVLEVEQEPADFFAYFSPDDGADWCAAGLLEPIAFADKTKKIRVAFRNNGADKVYIASFGVLF